MANHDLKTWPEYFEAVIESKKKVEVRKDDRGFQVGDRLHLEEFDPTTQEYTGRWADVNVTHIVGEPWLPAGTVAMSINLMWVGDTKRRTTLEARLLIEDERRAEVDGKLVLGP